MARRSDHSREEIKEMALEAVEKIVVEEGAAAVTARKVAAAIGYTVGSLYLVFKNLDDLTLQVNGRTLDELSQTLDAVVERCDSPEQCLHELGGAYIRFASENHYRWSLMVEHKLPEDMEVPAWYQQRIFSLFHRVETQFNKLAPERSEEELALAARALWSGVHGICILAMTGKLDVVGITDIHRLTELLIGSFLAGWRATPDAVLGKVPGN